MDYTLVFNPLTVSIVTGLVLGAGFLFLLVKYGIAWLIGDKQTVPAQAPAQQQAQPSPRRTLAGLSWIIATTHRSASQLIGLVMSSASLIAIILSVICAVAGITIISYQKFNSLFFSGVAALSTLILATLIESISINALKNIRLSNEAIAQAEQAHYEQIVKQMEESFSEDTTQFAQVNHQTLSKEEMESMKRAANLKQQARRQFEKKRHSLMRQQTRSARRTRNSSIPLAVAGVLFSATSGGLFWHTVLASLDSWLNIAIGTMFALVVSVTFVQSELLKRIKDDAIKEALQSGEKQSTMLRQQSEEMVLEMVVDSMAVTKEDPNTLQEMGDTIKGELKTAIRMLTAQTTSRLIEDGDDHPGIVVSEVPEMIPQIEEQAVSKRQRKEPEWLSNPALSMVLKMYPKLNEKVASWRTAGRVSVSILALINATSHSRRVIQNRIKDGTLQASPHNANLILINSVIDWLRDADVPVAKNAIAAPSEPITEVISVAIDPESVDQQTDDLPREKDSEWEEKLSDVLKVLQANPDVTDSELAAALGLETLEMARFWKVNAQLILQRGEPSVVGKSNGHVREQVNLAEFPEILV